MADTPVVSEQKDETNVSHMRTYASDVAKLTGKPLPRNVKNVPAPAPPPKEPEPAKIIPKAPTTNESREEVLKRLKEKSVVRGAPKPETPAYEPYPKAPTTSESREEVLKRLKKKAGVSPAPPPEAPQPPPPPLPTVKKDVALKAPERVHTYKSDFSEHATEKGATRISMLAAQADAANAPVVLAEKKQTNHFAFVVGAVLVLAGLGAVYAAYRFATGSPPIPVETAVPSLIFADERLRIEGSVETLRSSLAAPSVLSLEAGEAAVVYISYASSTKAGIIEIVATGAELIEALRLPAPAVLLRSIQPQSTVGVLNEGGEMRPFFIFSVDSYERSFAGMLEWEATLERDLSLFYPPHPEPPLEEVDMSISTTTASSTPSPAPMPFRLSFVDAVIGNRDVRILKDQEERTVFLYGYRDKETLVIARNEASFIELLERLSSAGRR